MFFSGSEPIHLSSALQKIKIEVNEYGTKATAATSKCVVTFYSMQCHMKYKVTKLDIWYFDQSYSGVGVSGECT